MDSENTSFSMPVAPAYSGFGMNNGGFGFGGDWSWILLLVLLCNGGWGGLGGFGGGYGGMYEFPWLLNGQNMINANTNAGFDHAATQTALGDLSTAVTAGFGNVQNSLCSGFAGVNAAITNAQMANMQSIFGVQSALQSCCCENRLGIANLGADIAREACASRATSTQNTQAILDKLCQLELDGYKRENDQLRSQLQFANMQASQVDQTAQLRANAATVANQLVSELRSCPIPAQPVYGNTPIFSCSGSASGCGCGAI